MEYLETVVFRHFNNSTMRLKYTIYDTIRYYNYPKKIVCKFHIFQRIHDNR